MLTPIVCDLAHFNPINFAKIKRAGIKGVIHKATQGIGFTDKAYASRREIAEDLDLLWGAYDFATEDDVKANVDKFVTVADPNDSTLMCLDFEDNSHSQMSAQQAAEFLDRLDQKLSRKNWIYGSNRLALISKLCENDDKQAQFFSEHPLWIAAYKNLHNPDLATLQRAIKLPYPWDWDTTLLIQYTGDGHGPLPHTVDGLQDGADLNVYTGAALEDDWAGA